MRLFISPEPPSSLEPKLSFLPLPFTSASFFEFLPSILDFKMGYAFLLNTAASLATFRQKFDIPDGVESNFALVDLLKGGVRFPVDLLLLNTLR